MNREQITHKILHLLGKPEAVTLILENCSSDEVHSMSVTRLRDNCCIATGWSYGTFDEITKRLINEFVERGYDVRVEYYEEELI